jgi:hypothetical protein
VNTIDEREWQLTLEMPTSRMAHAYRETEKTPAKQYQGETLATKVQQDLPVNVTINIQLLVWKAS